MRIIINPDVEVVKEIRKGLEENKAQFGARYCPCRVEHTPDTICMCKEFRDQEEGMCHCGLYIKVKE